MLIIFLHFDPIPFDDDFHFVLGKSNRVEKKAKKNIQVSAHDITHHHQQFIVEQMKKNHQNIVRTSCKIAVYCIDIIIIIINQF